MRLFSLQCRIIKNIEGDIMSKGEIDIKFDNNNSITMLKDNEVSKHMPYEIEDNKLKVIPKGKGMGWFADSRGSFLYDDASDNFCIETEV